MLFKTLKLEAKTRWPAYSWPHTRPHRLRKGEVYETTEGEGRRNEGGMAVSEPRGIPGDPVRAMGRSKEPPFIPPHSGPFGLAHMVSVIGTSRNSRGRMRRERRMRGERRERNSLPTTKAFSAHREKP